MFSINQNKVDLDNYFELLPIDYVNSKMTNLLMAELGKNGQLPKSTPSYLKCQQMYISF